MAIEKIDPYPWFLSKPMRLMVNERPVDPRISPTEWSDQWRPLMAKLYEARMQHPTRLMVAIVGPPGAGKSVFAEMLNWMCFRGILTKDTRSVVLPMDGFFYPNAYLESHHRVVGDSKIPLSWVKGQPDTIDVAALREALKQLKAIPENALWPGYSRVHSDPIPNSIKIHSSINLIFVDGNYLISDRPPFAGLKDFFDIKMYVEVPTAKILANLMDRHLKAGKNVEEAKANVKRIDLPIAKIAEQSKPNADVIVTKSTEDELTGVTWKGQSISASSSQKREESTEDQDKNVF